MRSLTSKEKSKTKEQAGIGVCVYIYMDIKCFMVVASNSEKTMTNGIDRLKFIVVN